MCVDRQRSLSRRQRKRGGSFAIASPDGEREEGVPAEIPEGLEGGRDARKLV